MAGLRILWTGLALGVVCAAGVGIRLQAADETRPSGIYVEPATGAAQGEAKRLTGGMAQVNAKVGAASAFGFGRPKMTTSLAGDTASIRVATDGTFLFVFSGRSDPRNMMADPTAAMGMMNELPGHTSSPKDYALIRLVVADGDRTWDSKKGEQVACAIEKVGPKVFRVKPQGALPPGEYGFALVTQGAAGMIWDFGVDAPAPK